MRNDNRKNNELRPITLEQNYTRYALGSVLITVGHTKVLCTASIEDRVPHFLRDSGEGWLSAEYSLLPSSTHTRCRREVSKGKASGRTSEIQRLIGRSLRAIIDFQALGERTITIDTDVLQADGGTRTAAITGSMLALSDAIQVLLKEKRISQNPIKEYLAAVSVGVVGNETLLDLCYEEDSEAEVDMNIVMTESGRFVEIQGTAEQTPFTKQQMDEMLSYSESGIYRLIDQVKHLSFNTEPALTNN